MSHANRGAAVSKPPEFPQLTASEVRMLIDAGEFVLAGPDPFACEKDCDTLRRAVDELKNWREAWLEVAHDNR